MKLTEFGPNGDTVATFENAQGHQYRVRYDIFSDDPREFYDCLAPCLIVGGDRRADKEEHPLLRLFHEVEQGQVYVYINGTEVELGDDAYTLSDAIDLVNRLNREHDIAPGQTLQVFQEHGYSQGDVWNIVVVAGVEDTNAKDTAEVLGGYLRGDVYTVECDCGNMLGMMDGYGLDYESAVQDFIGEVCEFDTEAPEDAPQPLMTIVLALDQDAWGGLPEVAKRAHQDRILASVQADKMVSHARVTYTTI